MSTMKRSIQSHGYVVKSRNWTIFIYCVVLAKIRLINEGAGSVDEQIKAG